MTKNNRGEASCLPSILLSVAAPAASDRDPQDGTFGPVFLPLKALLPCCVAAPAALSESAELKDEPPILFPGPESRITRASAHRPVARPETEGRFPAPGRDVATAATPAVTRNASGVLFEAAAAGLAEKARRGG
jgi:hypothetical protein